MKIKGLCKDCNFIHQDWLMFEDSNGQMNKEIDWCCSVCDIFKNLEHGYCDLWEPRV